jgi:hypothetical protein
MRQPRVLVYENDGRLAAQLRDAAQGRRDRKEPRWTLHECRQADGCVELLRPGGRGVLVLKLASPRQPAVALEEQDPAEEAAAVERAVVRELTLLERISRLCPEAATVVVADADHAHLAALCWDLGAAYVFAPPQPRDWLPEVIAGLLGLPGGRPDRPPSPPKSDA